MKKTLLTLIAASAVILSFVGCKPATKDAIDNDSGSWKGQVSTRLGEGDSDRMSVTMKVTKPEYAPVTTNTDNDEWFLWTDTKGIVLKKQPKATKIENGNKFDFTKDTNDQDVNFLDLVDYNNATGSEEFVLYTCINGTGKKGKTNVTLKDNDVRGRICVYKDRKVEFESHKYYEVIEHVGIVTITNDEPVASSLYTDGNYVITEIWPLDPSEGSNGEVDSKYHVSDTMVFKGLEIKKGDTVSFPVKADKTNGIKLGLYQPKRAKTENGHNATAKDLNASDLKNGTLSDGSKIADVYKLDITSSDTTIINTYKKNNADMIFAEDIKVEPHKTLSNMNSSAFGKYYFKHDNTITRWKAVYNDYVTEVELHEGRLEK